MAIKETIDSGKLGAIRGARAFITWDRSDDYYKQSDWKGTWDKEGGGVLIDQAIHTIDLMQWFVGEVESIRATYDTRAHEYIDVDDVAEAYIKFKNGAIACVYANCFYVYDAPIYLEIVGTEEGRADRQRSNYPYRRNGASCSRLGQDRRQGLLGQQPQAANHRFLHQCPEG